MSEALTELLKQCTFRVVTASSTGTCFAVNPTLAVTCRHVVEDVALGDEVLLQQAEGGRERKAKVIRTLPSQSPGAQLIRSDRWPDLALLEVLEEDSFPTTVLLDTGRPELESTLFVAGFPATAEIPYQTRMYQAGTSANVDEVGNRYTQLSGESIDPGQSGAPVLTPEGFVCGYVRVTRAQRTPLGGFFVPLLDVLGMVPELDVAYRTPGGTVREWLDHITGVDLKTHGRDAKGNRFGDEPQPSILDLQLTQVETAEGGEIRQWKVAADTEHLDATLQTGALGEGVLEAVDYWSRRHPLVSKKQVDLLGRVLLRGLLPATIGDFLRQMDKHQPPIVRLRTERKDALSAIPWEYAEGLATSEEWSFVRYVPVHKGRVNPLKRISALVVVNPIEGVDTSEVSETLRDYMAQVCKHIDFDIRHSLKITEFISLARQGWDVVHYVGTGWSNGDLGFPREFGAGRSPVEPIEWDTLCPNLRASRAKLVVLQVGPSQFELAANLSTYLDLLEGLPSTASDPTNEPELGEARALVLGQHVTTMEHVLKFSGPFYNSLDKGMSVEQSVQSARLGLFTVAPAAAYSQARDHAAFGTVSVVTSIEGNIRLLERDFDAGDTKSGSGKRAAQQAPGGPVEPSLSQGTREPGAVVAPPGEGFER